MFTACRPIFVGLILLPALACSGHELHDEGSVYSAGMFRATEASPVDQPMQTPEREIVVPISAISRVQPIESGGEYVTVSLEGRNDVEQSLLSLVALEALRRSAITGLDVSSAPVTPDSFADIAKYFALRVLRFRDSSDVISQEPGWSQSREHAGQVFSFTDFLNPLSRFSSLTVFDLAGTRLPLAIFKQLPQLANLQYLAFAGSPELAYAEFPNVVGQLRNLHSVRLKKVRAPNNGVLRGLAQLPLRHVDLENMEIDISTAFESFAPRWRLDTLRVWNIRGLHQNLGILSNLPVSELSLGSRVAIEQPALVAMLCTMPNLRTVHLAKESVAEDARAAIERQLRSHFDRPIHVDLL